MAAIYRYSLMRFTPRNETKLHAGFSLKWYFSGAGEIPVGFLPPTTSIQQQNELCQQFLFYVCGGGFVLILLERVQYILSINVALFKSKVKGA